MKFKFINGIAVIKEKFLVLFNWLHGPDIARSGPDLARIPGVGYCADTSL